MERERERERERESERERCKLDSSEHFIFFLTAEKNPKPKERSTGIELKANATTDRGACVSNKPWLFLFRYWPDSKIFIRNLMEHESTRNS